ncbi:MAG TPA: hypothetical protein VHU88_06330 [Sporichthyaceae bacterium]|jgi:hypothetical protein|nr:hypothetical protein [Sporichthyaceae bacterium]
MNTETIRARLHDAMHHSHRNATEEELAEVGALVLTVVAAVTAELAEVIAELSARVTALESAAGA